MGQIQNALTGAVSSIIGAQVAGELKTQREITQVNKDLDTWTSETKKHFEKSKAIADENIERYSDVYLTKAGKERKIINPEKEQAYNEWADKAFASLEEENKMLGGWQENLKKRVDALKAKGVENLEFDLARKNANEMLAEARKVRGGNQ